MRKTVLLILALHAATWCVSQCLPPVEGLLDESLQRALLTKYDDLGVQGYPDQASVDPPQGIDCVAIIDRIAAASPRALPPSVAGDVLDRGLGSPFLRWYLVSFDPDGAEFSDLFATVREAGLLMNYALSSSSAANILSCLDLGVAGTVRGATCGRAVAPAPRSLSEAPFGDEIHVSEDLGVFLIQVSTMRQFRTLVRHLRNFRTAHIMENYPLQPAVGKTLQAIGLSDDNIFSVYSGAGFAVAILDTGIEASDYFTSPADDGTATRESRIVYEACFSSEEYVGTFTARTRMGIRNVEVFTDSLCREGDEPSETWQSILPGVSTSRFQPRSFLNGDGHACSGASRCTHGTSVAYLAAGSDPVADREPGVAPEAAIVSIQVASIAPYPYCEYLHSTCVAILPIDLLRALHHIESILEDPQGELEGTTLVAINISQQIKRWCDPMFLGFEHEGCENADTPAWGFPNYARPCNRNPFAWIVADLEEVDVRTVIGAGNVDSSDPEKLGVVSLPGCVERAVTVAATDHDRSLWEGSKMSWFVDLLAPGYDVVTPNTRGSDSGTSYATAVVTGALARMRHELRACGRNEFPDDMDELSKRTETVQLGDFEVPDGMTTKLGLQFSGASTLCATDARRP